jgi:hypothetical protein
MVTAAGWSVEGENDRQKARGGGLNVAQRVGGRVSVHAWVRNEWVYMHVCGQAGSDKEWMVGWGSTSARLSGCALMGTDG